MDGFAEANAIADGCAGRDFLRFCSVCVCADFCADSAPCAATSGTIDYAIAVNCTAANNYTAAIDHAIAIDYAIAINCASATGYTNTIAVGNAAAGTVACCCGDSDRETDDCAGNFGAGSRARAGSAAESISGIHCASGNSAYGFVDYSTSGARVRDYCSSAKCEYL